MLGTDLSASIAPILRDADTDLHVPALCDVEVAAGLRNATIRKILPEARAMEAVADYLDLPVRRHGHQGLLPRILALGSNFSAYDATYAALAEHLNASLLTADRRLAKAVRSHTKVEVVATN